MNAGTTVLLLFLLFAAAFLGVGYMYSKIDQQSGEIQELQSVNQKLQKDLDSANQALKNEQDAHSKTMIDLENAQALVGKLQVELSNHHAKNNIPIANSENDNSQKYVFPSNIFGDLPYEFLFPIGLFLSILVTVNYFRDRNNSRDIITIKNLDNPLIDSLDSPSGDTITVKIPRNRVTEFVKWLRKG